MTSFHCLIFNAFNYTHRNKPDIKNNKKIFFLEIITLNKLRNLKSSVLYFPKSKMLGKGPSHFHVHAVANSIKGKPDSCRMAIEMKPL